MACLVIRAKLTVVIGSHFLQLRSHGGTVLLRLRWLAHTPFVGRLGWWRDKTNQRTINAFLMLQFLNPKLLVGSNSGDFMPYFIIYKNCFIIYRMNCFNFLNSARQRVKLSNLQAVKFTSKYKLFDELPTCVCSAKKSVSFFSAGAGVPPAEESIHSCTRGRCL